MGWPVSVKAVLGWDDRIVLLRNDRDGWELPGGRLEAAERPEDALIRELREELDVEATVGPLLLAESFEVVPGRWVLVLAYRCEAPEPATLTFSDEHQAVVAAATGDLDGLALPPVYRRAIEAARCQSDDERPELRAGAGRPATRVAGPDCVIRPFDVDDLDTLRELSLHAWEPVYASLGRVLGEGLLGRLHADWRVDQARAVTEVCSSAETSVWVAEVDRVVVGFVATKLDTSRRLGEIDMVAVDPSYQRRGIGRALTDLGVEQLRDAGMEVVMVETGGDPGHAPARATYEDAGFTLLPIARYFKPL